jgi:hypothetical protein
MVEQVEPIHAPKLCLVTCPPLNTITSAVLLCVQTLFPSWTRPSKAPPQGSESAGWLPDMGWRRDYGRAGPSTTTMYLYLVCTE